MSTRYQVLDLIAKGKATTSIDITKVLKANKVSVRKRIFDLRERGWIDYDPMSVSRRPVRYAVTNEGRMQLTQRGVKEVKPKEIATPSMTRTSTNPFDWRNFIGVHV